MRPTQWVSTVVLVAAFGAGTAWMLVPGEAGRLRQEKEQLERERFELQRAVQRLTGEDRMAEVHVLAQVLKGEIVNGKPAASDQTTLEFIEMDREQHPLPAKRFVVSSRVIHFDALVIKFDHEDVAQAQALRGKSLALFRRVYGETQNPADGFPVDAEGDVPNVYRVQPKPGAAEQKLWSQFWDYARNPDLAARDRVRVAQGESVYVPMERGDVWAITLQHNGGLNIKLRRSAHEGPMKVNSQAPVAD